MNYKVHLHFKNEFITFSTYRCLSLQAVNCNLTVTVHDISVKSYIVRMKDVHRHSNLLECVKCLYRINSVLLLHTIFLFPANSVLLVHYIIIILLSLLFFCCTVTVSYYKSNFHQ